MPDTIVGINKTLLVSDSFDELREFLKVHRLKEYDCFIFCSDMEFEYTKIADLDLGLGGEMTLNAIVKGLSTVTRLLFTREELETRICSSFGIALNSEGFLNE